MSFGFRSLNLGRPHQFQDCVPDERRQAVPGCDQLAECLVLPAMFRPGTKRHAVTTYRANACENGDAGAIPAASTTFHKRTSIRLPFSGSHLRPTPITPIHQAHRHPGDRMLPGSAITALRASFRPLAQVAVRRASRPLLVPRDVHAARSSARCRCVASLPLHGWFLLAFTPRN
jgi:hypothetical protein